MFGIKITFFWLMIRSKKVFYFCDLKFIPGEELTAIRGLINSSLHWLILLSFLFVFVQWSVLVALQLSAGDAIVSQKGSSGERK